MLRASVKQLGLRSATACSRRESTVTARARSTDSKPKSTLRWEKYASIFGSSPAPTATVLEAHQKGTLGFGFSAGGLLFPYYVGVTKALHELGILGLDVPVAGASAGSLIAACYKSGMPAEVILAACLQLAQDCRRNGTRFRLQSVLEQVIREVLPHDAHVRCSGTTFIAVTRVYPDFQPQLVSEFTSREHLISTLLTSCHIPWYFNGRLTTCYNDARYFDGGLTNFIPVPPGLEHGVQVCCFPAKQLRTFPNIQIAPDVFEHWPHDIRSMVSWALEPADEEFLLSFVEKGSRDATTWAVANGLVGGEDVEEKAEGAGREVDGVLQR